MKVLFIGGTGNISADCAALAVSQGHEVGVLTRGRQFCPPAYRVFQADRKDLSALRRVVKEFEPEVVVNFLGYELAEVQIDHAATAGKVRQYIFISSATVYAKPPPSLPIRETAPLGNNYWDYAAKKVECERWLIGQWETNQFPVTIVRPSHTYSKSWVPNPVSSGSYTFAQRVEQGKPVWVHGDGFTPWTLTTSRDFAVGLVGLIGNPAALGEAYHITSDEVLTWNEIYAEIAAALGLHLPEVVRVPVDFICQAAPRLSGTLKGDKAHPAVFDNSKIKRLVSAFECRTRFREGVRESVAWLKEHPEHKNLRPELDEEIDRVVAAWKSARG